MPWLEIIVGNTTVDIRMYVCLFQNTFVYGRPSVFASQEQGETGTFDMYKDERIKCAFGRELSNIWDLRKKLTSPLIHTCMHSNESVFNK